ncbi:MAG: hypothetical protein HPY75_07300 [Actinobacteria bacterium]|nr:hypothetical protein [Actinomycetota bacterium]
MTDNNRIVAEGIAYSYGDRPAVDRTHLAAMPMGPDGRSVHGASRADDTRSMREEARRHDG